MQSIAQPMPFASRKAAALHFGVTRITIDRWLRNGRLSGDAVAGRRLQAWETADYPIARYPVHTGPDWIERTERDQVRRLGLRRWQRLAHDADAEIATCGTH